MFTIGFPAARLWHVSVPTVCRYMHTQFVEDFFATGALRLRSLHSYKTEESDVRRDESEGSMSFTINGKKLRIGGRLDYGKRCYALCGSLVESDEQMHRFETDNFLRIHNPIGFADVVSRYIPGFFLGHIGPCIYRPLRDYQAESTRDFGLTAMMDTMRDGVVDDKEKEKLEASLNQSRAQMGEDIEAEVRFQYYFLKPEVPYAQDLEYRAIWVVPNEISCPLNIHVPEAIQFCTAGIETERLKANRYVHQPHSSGFIVASSNHNGLSVTNGPDANTPT